MSGSGISVTSSGICIRLAVLLIVFLLLLSLDVIIETVVLIDRNIITRSQEGDIGAFNEMVRDLTPVAWRISGEPGI